MIGSKLPIVLALVLLAGTAHAQSASDMATARDLFKEGITLRDQGKLGDALAKLKAAHDLYETPPSTLELGRTQVQLGLLVEGYETLLSVDKIPIRDKDSERSREARVEAPKLAAEVLPRIPTLRVAFAPVRDDVVVTVDGAVLPPSMNGQSKRMNPGTHAVVLRTKSGKELKSDAVLVEGKVFDLRLRVPDDAPATTAPPPVDHPLELGKAEIAALDADEEKGRQFGVHFKFLLPQPDSDDVVETWTLKSEAGKVLCTLPCSRWIAQRSGAYLERAAHPKNDPTHVSTKEVPVPDEFSSGGTPGTEIIVRPVPGVGAAKLAQISFIVLSTPEILGLILGPTFLGICLANNRDECRGALDIATGVSIAFGALFIPHLIWALATQQPRLDFVGAGFSEPGQQGLSVKVGSVRAWPTPFGIAGTF